MNNCNRLVFVGVGLSIVIIIVLFDNLTETLKHRNKQKPTVRCQQSTYVSDGMDGMDGMDGVGAHVSVGCAHTVQRLRQPNQIAINKRSA